MRWTWVLIVAVTLAGLANVYIAGVLHGRGEVMPLLRECIQSQREVLEMLREGE